MRILKFIALAALVAFTQTGIVSGSALQVPEDELVELKPLAEYIVAPGPGASPVTGLFATTPVYALSRTNTGRRRGSTSILTLMLPGNGSDLDEWKSAFTLLLDALNAHSSTIASVVIPPIVIPESLQHDLNEFVHTLFQGTTYSISIMGNGSGIEPSVDTGHKISQVPIVWAQSQIVANSAAKNGHELICRFLVPAILQTPEDRELTAAISAMTVYDLLTNFEKNTQIVRRVLPHSDLTGGAAAAVHIPSSPMGGTRTSSPMGTAVSPRSPPSMTSSIPLASLISAPRSRSGSPSPSRSQSPSPSVLRPSYPNIGGSSLHGGLSGDAYVQQFGVRAPDQPQRMQLIGAEDKEDEDMRQAIKMSPDELAEQQAILQVIMETENARRLARVLADTERDLEAAKREQAIRESIEAEEARRLAQELNEEAQLLDEMYALYALEQSGVSNTAAGGAHVSPAANIGDDEAEIAQAIELSLQDIAHRNGAAARAPPTLAEYWKFAQNSGVTYQGLRDIMEGRESGGSISPRSHSTASTHGQATRVSSEGVKPSARTGAAHVSPAANDDDELKAAIALSLRKSP